jgi:osmotically-inducible protein OsmY
MKLRTFMFIGVGAAAAYFLDPEKGTQRRQVAQERMNGIMGKASSQAQEIQRQTGVNPSKVVQKISGGAQTPVPESDYATLAEKVKTELFSDPDVKGHINVDAEQGIVFLRGALTSRQKIEEVVAKTRGVAGVKDVKNLLHTPTTAAKA